MAESDDPTPGTGGRHRDPIPTTPHRHRHTRHPHTGGGSTTDPGGNGGSGGSGDGHAKDPYAAAQAHADAREDEARAREKRKQIANAKTIQQQIDGLRKQLGPHGLSNALHILLGNARGAWKTKDADALKGYRERVQTLRDDQSDNEKAAEQGSEIALQNRSRERANAMSEVAAQGAGESDLLRAQGASLRNWQANQSGVTRAFYDQLTSENASLTELTADTRGGRIQLSNDYSTGRSSLWEQYYSDRGEALTNLGNAWGLKAEYYGLANAAEPSKHLRKLQRQAAKKSGDFIDRASLTTGKAWEDPGVPKYIRKWEGASDIEGSLNSSYRGNTLTEIAPKKPEGATLRTWRT